MSTHKQKDAALITYQVGPVWCCASSQPVLAVVQPAPVTRVPGSSARRPGIINYAGHVLPITDLRVAFGVDEGEQQTPGRLIIIDLGDRRAGFHVDRIGDVVPWPDEGWGPLPSMLPREVFNRVWRRDKQIHLFADFGRLDNLQADGLLRQYIEHLQQAPSLAPEDQPATGHRKTTPAVTPELTPADAPQAPPNSAVHAAPFSDSGSPTRAPSPGANSEPVTRQPPRASEQVPESPPPAQNQLPIRTPQPTHDSSAEVAQRVTSPQASELRRSASTNAAKSDRVSSTITVKPSPLPGRGDGVEPRKPAAAGRKPISRQAATVSNRKNSVGVSPAVPTSVSPSLERLATKTNPVTPMASPNRAGKPSTRPSHDHTTESVLFAPLLVLLVVLAAGGAAGWFWFAYDHDPLVRSENDMRTPNKRPGNLSEALSGRTAPWATESHAPDTEQTGPNPEAGDSPPPDSHTRNLPSRSRDTVESSPESASQTRPVPDPFQIRDTFVPAAENETVEITQQDTPSDNEIATNSTVQEQPTFQADILRDDGGITIVLNTPRNADAFKAPAKTLEPDTDPVEPETSLSATKQPNSAIPEAEPEHTAPDSEPARSPVATPSAAPDPAGRIINEIVHVVVKGDTLWHIAKRYVNDPFRYPELARLSNIRNPDLIYPGDRVRIIQITN